MKKDLYTFEYSTKTNPRKTASYRDVSFIGAWRRFEKNCRVVALFRALRNGERIA